jgi:uncharacterized protein YacL
MKIGLLLPIVAILIGMVGAASYLVSRVPSMRKTIEKLAMYQAGIGATGAVIGILQGMDILFSSQKGFFMLWLVAVITCFSCVLVGLILGYPLLQSIILDDLSEESRNKAASFRNAIAPFQILCGLMALGGGFYLLIKVLI